MEPSAQAFSGLAFLSGLPEAPPAGWGWSSLDDTGGMYIAFSTLTSLYRRNITGQGQHVDLSQMIMGATLNGSAMLDATINGRPSQREGYPPGNRAHWPGTPMLNNYRGPTTAPHNAYRTKGAASRRSEDEACDFHGRSGLPNQWDLEEGQWESSVWAKL